MSYIDGFVTPVPTSNKAAYLEHAKKFGEILKAEYGALRVVECWSDEVPPGKVTDFQGAVKAKEDEAIVFSWIEWPSKQVRDAFGEKMQSDPHFRDYLLFHEYYDGDTGRGLGASHQTGWSALVANMITELHE